jgi:Mor family transcriptional regulator
MSDDFLTNLRDTITAHHVDDSIAENIINSIRKLYGGNPFYIKKTTGGVDSRNAEIYCRLTGKKHADLCREFGLGYQQICKIVKAERKKQGNHETQKIFN